MMNRILIPLDGSKLGEAVVPYASQLAKGLGASMTLFHVEGPDGAKDALEAGYLDGAAELVRNQGLAAETGVRSGVPAPEIVRFAEEEGFNLIAMSTHGRSGLNRLISGSVADAVLHSVEIPLLLIKPSKQAQEVQLGERIQRIIVPLDGSPLAEVALGFAETLGTHMGLEIVLVQVVGDPVPPNSGYEGISYEPRLSSDLEELARQYTKARETELIEHGLQASALVIRGHPASRIVDLAREGPLSLVVMSTHGRSGMRRSVLGSVADQTLRCSHRPVLLIRPRMARTVTSDGRDAKVRQPA